MNEYSDEDGHLFIQIPSPFAETSTNVFSAVASLWYGYNNSVDLLELCGGWKNLPGCIQQRTCIRRQS
eukprot:11164382-Lingulodinium_polyedra.AAC.1